MDASVATESEGLISTDLIDVSKIEQRAKERLDRLKQQPLVLEARRIIQEARLREKGYAYHFGEQQGVEDHTEDVMYEALFLAEYQNVLVGLIQAGGSKFEFLPGEPTEVLTEEEMEDLGYAAAFHETGFAQIDQTEGRAANGRDHEGPAARNAREAMARLGFSPERVARVSKSIEDTAVKYGPVEVNGQWIDSMQIPTTGNTLSPFLLDGDVRNFGRTDCSQKSDQVFNEVNNGNVANANRLNFDSFALNALLRRHHWQTAPARLLGEDKKQENITVLARKIEQAQVLVSPQQK